MTEKANHIVASSPLAPSNIVYSFCSRGRRARRSPAPPPHAPRGHLAAAAHPRGSASSRTPTNTGHTELQHKPQLKIPVEASQRLATSFLL